MRGPLPCEADLLDVLARAGPAILAALRGRRGEVLGDERGVVDDHGQQIVEVVGDASRELPEALQALSLMQLVLQPLALGLGLEPLALAGCHDAIADVADCGDRDGAAVGLDARQADLGWELSAIATPTQHLQPGAHRPCAWVGEIPRPVGAMWCAEAPGHEHLHRLSQQLFARVPEQHLHLRVDQQDQAVAADPHDRVRGELQQCHLRAQARRDVPVDLQQPHQAPGLIALRGPAALHDQAPAVLGVLDQIALPVSGLADEPLDLLQRYRVLRLQQLTCRDAQRFRGREAVGALRSAVPEGDPPLGVSREDRVGGEVEQRRLRREPSCDWRERQPCRPLLPPTVPSKAGVPHPGPFPQLQPTTAVRALYRRAGSQLPGDPLEQLGELVQERERVEGRFRSFPWPTADFCGCQA